MHEVNYVWKVSMASCEKPRQMTLNTTLWDVLNALRSSFLPFPPTVDSSMKNDGCKSFLFHFDLCLLLWCFWKGFLGVSKGGSKQVNAKGKKKKQQKRTFKNRAGNQIITLTLNFGIRCFGHTILSLWFWLFSTKHPVIKGRLVVGLFLFPFKFWQNSSPSPCTNWSEREKESKKERGGLLFFFLLVFFFLIIIWSNL